MARPKTARDLARQAELGTQASKPSFDVLLISEGVGCVLLVLLGIILVLQALAAQRNTSDGEALAEAARSLQQAIAAQVATVADKVEKGVLDPTLAARFEQGETMDLAQTREYLRSMLGNPLDLQIVVGSDVMEAVGADLATFGYAKLDLLRQAESSRSVPPVQMMLEKNESRSLAVAAPVLRQTRPLGYVLARYDAEPLRQLFGAWQGSGRMELRQGSGEGITLLGSSEQVYLDRNSSTLPIPRSSLKLLYGLPPSFMAFKLGPGAALLLALLCLVGAVALLWFRIAPRRRLAKPVTGPQPIPAPAAAEVAPPARSLESALAAAQAADPAAARSTEPKKAERGPAPAPAPVSPAPAVRVDRSIFRAYDIRGVIDQTLTPAVANLIGRAIGSEVRARNLREVVVARDGRLSGPSLVAGLIEGLRATGCDVIDIGMVPTPVLYFATYELRTQSGVMVTGSHNPPDYNGFKIMVGGETLSDQAIQDLYGRIAENRYASGQGAIQSIDVMDAYVERISSDIQLEMPLKVVVDCGNGVPGVVAERLLASIGCEVMPLYTEVDGTFPNHHPDPSDPQNLTDLLLTVKQVRADLGVAFDGDGDRLGVVTPAGKIIYPDRLLMLFAQDVLLRNPGASIIYDVKCTGHLGSVIRAAGGVPIMWRTGHSLIKGKMRETEAELAGEMSGHFFFKERWFGFDDGLYSACRLLEILAASGQDADEIFDALPDSVSTPELKIPMQEGEHYRFMEKFQERARFDGARITTIDGVRADWDDGWGLVRCSNTTPVLVLRFDGDSDAALLRIQDVFRKQLLALNPRMHLPF